jgi:hypothetical protein
MNVVLWIASPVVVRDLLLVPGERIVNSMRPSANAAKWATV